MDWFNKMFGMKCNVCKTPIQCEQYTGLGEYEKLCVNCAIPVSKSKQAERIKLYKEAKEEGYEYMMVSAAATIKNNEELEEENTKLKNELETLKKDYDNLKYQWDSETLVDLRLYCLKRRGRE